MAPDFLSNITVEEVEAAEPIGQMAAVWELKNISELLLEYSRTLKASVREEVERRSRILKIRVLKYELVRKEDFRKNINERVEAFKAMSEREQTEEMIRIFRGW